MDETKETQKTKNPRIALLVKSFHCSRIYVKITIMLWGGVKI
jgi:hypothetical protein